jgi:hypothetical protein
MNLKADVKNKWLAEEHFANIANTFIFSTVWTDYGIACVTKDRNKRGNRRSRPAYDTTTCANPMGSTSRAISDKFLGFWMIYGKAGG